MRPAAPHPERGRRGLLRALADTRLTIAGFVVLGAAIVANRWLPTPAAWLLTVPLALLAANLAAALAVFPRLRGGGLGVFHFALLGCLLLVAGGRLTHFDGRLSIVDGQEFDPRAVEVDARGPWHADGYRALAFRQGPFTVDYAPGVRREHTRSRVALPTAGGGTRWDTVGDDTPLKLEGYRLYTTANKGFAPVLTWTAAGHAPVTGAVMLPSFPLNDWQQAHRWTAPGGAQWQFWLRPGRKVDETAPWTLEPARTESVLVAEAAGQRFELRPGEQAVTPAGTLRYEWLAGWMGYRIFYDQTLVPLLVLAVLGVLGMAQFLWATRERQGRRHDTTTAGAWQP